MLLTLLGCFPASAADDVDKVNGLLRRAEANLQSVASSLSGRTTPPRGSAGKLLANRLQQALDDLTPAKSLLETIPSSAPGRDEAAARYSAAAEEYNRLRAIMTGSDAPPPPSDEGVKLNYQQEELLKNARFHLREVEGNAEHLTAQTERLRVVEDQLAIDHREVIALRSVIDNARRKTGFARDTLGQLPADGQGVADISQRVVNADAKVSVAADYLNPLHAALQDLINPANYPQFEPDRKRLRDLAIMFGDTMLLQTNRPLAAETLAQAEASKAECLRIAQAYFRLIQQQTDQGKAIEGIGNGFLRNHAEFLAAAEAMRSTLPDEIRSDLATARQQGADAVAQQKPLWFTGGIPQVLGYAEDRLVLLAAIDPDAALQLDRELAQTRTDLKTQADSLRELIIRENRMPGDGFQGPDRDEAIEIARSAWNVQQQEYEVLAVRIPAEQWRRETKWTFSNGTWYFSDKSRLQVRLFVADHENPELAIDRVITVWKDHQAGDSMYGIPLRSFDETLEPSAYLLRDNVMP
ncbi:MAG: hypothetical protein AAGH71_07635 [Planctomycetota bacterium]